MVRSCQAKEMELKTRTNTQAVQLCRGLTAIDCISENETLQVSLTEYSIIVTAEIIQRNEFTGTPLPEQQALVVSLCQLYCNIAASLVR